MIISDYIEAPKFSCPKHGIQGSVIICTRLTNEEKNIDLCNDCLVELLRKECFSLVKVEDINK